MADLSRNLVRRDKQAKKASFLDGKNHLFVIGINAYLHCPPLSNCVQDAQVVTSILQKQYNFDSSYTTSLFDKQATRRNILFELDQFKTKVQTTDNLIIYFSGHGELRNDYGYWVPYEAQPEYTGDFISTHDIISRLNVIESLHTFLIVDACFSGSIFIERKAILELTDFSKPSRLGLSSCHSHEVAMDGKVGDNSPFAACLIEELQRSNKSLNAMELGTLVREGVNRKTMGKQSPTIRPIHVKGDMLGVFTFFLKNHEESKQIIEKEVQNIATHSPKRKLDSKSGGELTWDDKHSEKKLFENMEISDLLIKMGKKIKLLPSKSRGQGSIESDILMDNEYWWFKKIEGKTITRSVQKAISVGKKIAPNILFLIDDPSFKVHELTFGIYNALKYDKKGSINKVSVFLKTQKRLISLTRDEILGGEYVSKFYDITN